jgi:hypothetical protein
MGIFIIFLPESDNDKAKNKRGDKEEREGVVKRDTSFTSEGRRLLPWRFPGICRSSLWKRKMDR